MALAPAPDSTVPPGDHPGAAAAAVQALRPVTLEGRYQIDPGQPLPDLDTPSSRAYAVEDRQDGGRTLFALIANPKHAVRAGLFEVLGGTPIRGLMPLATWGAVDWPLLGERCMAVIYDRPLGGRVALTPWGKGSPIEDSEITKRVIEPVAAALQRLSAREFAHRAIRPDNLFFMDVDQRDVVLGDCITAPAGFDQSAVFETIERGMASPAGRGEGTVADDLYALGVTVAFLALRGAPLHRLEETEVLHLKAEQGTYAALFGRERIPMHMLEPLRGLLNDDAAERWALPDVDQWLSGKRQSPIQRRATAKAETPILIGDQPEHTLRTAAYTMSKNPTEGARIVRNGDLEGWLRRHLVDTAKADSVAAAREAAAAHQNDELGTNDYLVAKVCIVLDPQGPIRFKGLAAMPDGLGAAMAADYLRDGAAQTTAEILAGDLPAAWFGSKAGSRLGGLGPSRLERDLMGLRMFLQNSALGFGLERCLYAFNPGMPCQSPLIAKEFVVSIDDLLPALEQASKKTDGKSKPIDRHIAAFVAERARQDVSAYLDALNSSDPKTSAAGLLSLLALLQWRLETGPLLALTSWVGGHLAPVIASFHSRATRRAIEREVPRLIRQGNIADLYEFLENKDKRKADGDGFALARAQHAAAQAEIEQIERSDSARTESAEQMGLQMAALSSVVLTLIVLSVFVLADTF